MKVLLVVTFFTVLCLTQDHRVNAQPAPVEKWLERQLQQEIARLRRRPGADYQDTQMEVLNNILQNGILRSLK